MSDSLHTHQLVEGDRVTALRRRKLRLEVVKGPDRKLRGDFEGDRIVVGTHEHCDLVLTDPTVSRQHFEISLVVGGYRIRDLASRNGLRIDGLRVHDAELERDATLELGTTRIKMTLRPDVVDLPLSDRTRLGPLVGHSPAMRRVFELVERVAPTSSTVLITGESGTGKEVAARTVHELSPRRNAGFVVIDCAALPPTLIESELYGHERGAFTGAERARKGAFETAHGGTIFLDEIGELPIELQTRLLGAIERRQVQPLGGGVPRPVDVRLVAATNRDLRKEVNRGTFRADLYFRLAVVDLHMPPLRDRPEDIPLYVDAFVREQAEAGTPVSIGSDTIAALMERPWPGNVRELRNALERAAALGDMAPSTPDDAPLSTADASPTATTAVDPTVPFKTGKALLVQSYERAYVEALMRHHDGNITQAARAAEIDRVYLLRLLDKFELRATKQRRGLDP